MLVSIVFPIKISGIKSWPLLNSLLDECNDVLNVLP